MFKFDITSGPWFVQKGLGIVSKYIGCYRLGGYDRENVFSWFNNIINYSWCIHDKKMLDEWNIIRSQLRSKAKTWRRRRLYLKYMHWLHVLPNAGIIVLSLLYGANEKEDPFGRSICLAGMMAYDTDCNCGNVGTIMGVLHGAENIPKRWTTPLKDEFHTYVKDHEHWKISELAERIAKIGVKVIKEKCPEKAIM